MHLLKVRRADGAIVGRWSSDQAEVLEAQRTLLDDEHDGLRYDEDIDLRELCEDMHVRNSMVMRIVREQQEK